MNAQAVSALLCGKIASDDCVHVSGARLEQPVVVMDARLERLELRDVVTRGDLTITGCRINVLEIVNLQLVRGAAFALHDCVVDTIELRSFAGRGATTIERVRCATILAHSIRRFSMLGCATEDAVSLSRLSGGMSLCDSAFGELVIHDLDDDELDIEINDVSCRRELDIHSGSVRSMAITGSRAESVRLQRLVTHSAQSGVVLSGCGVSGDVTFEALTNTSGSAVRIYGSRISGSVVIGKVDVPSDTSSIAQLDDSFIGGDMRLAAQAHDAPTCQIQDTTIAGTLRLAALDASHNPQGRGLVDLRASSVTDIMLPAERLRTAADVKRLAVRLYGGPTVDGLSALRSALAAQHRALDEDAVYAVLQDRRADVSAAGRVRRGVFGGVFGWGVRLGPPARALALFILMTAVIGFIFINAPGSAAERLVTASLRAVGLWTDIDVKLAHEPTSSAYGAMRVVAGTGGIVFATVLVGIVIRKLVR